MLDVYRFYVHSVTQLINNSFVTKQISITKCRSGDLKQEGCVKRYYVPSSLRARAEGWWRSVADLKKSWGLSEIYKTGDLIHFYGLLADQSFDTTFVDPGSV
ncbi:hypothetical protein CDAR_378191 [Caerostris darwini]|uniref:Uncharacterized protein n=1 Tax=Caerostris darwini TaxID=1538125 RepID=A0AAV4P6F1_9ARAC|nr:hypothetical protein CDAR_378191 [Caerostris darwini]